MAMWHTNLNPELIRRVEAFLADAARQGIRLQVVSGFRSYAQQNALYQRAQRGQSHLPAAKPGTSQHEFGRAVDVGVVGKTSTQVSWATWQKIGAIGTANGLRWLGAKDRVHFELPRNAAQPSQSKPPTRPSAPAPSGNSTPETPPQDDGWHLPSTLRDAAWYGGALIGGAALAQLLIIGAVLVGGVWALNSLTRPSEN